MEQHTPLPWTQDGLSIRDSKMDAILYLGHSVKTKEESQANIKFICIAVNSHEELLALAKRSDEYIRDREASFGDTHPSNCIYCQAIAKAEGK